MLYILLQELKEAEDRWRSSSVEWKRKINAYENWAAKAKDRKQQLERTAKQKRDKDSIHTRAADPSWESSFNPHEPSPQFSFAGTTSYSQKDLQEEIEKLVRWNKIDTRVLQALKRGIGIHHSGMSKAYRSLVERYDF